MEIYIAYGVVTAVMLGITLLFYNVKNWLALRKNAIYLRMLVLLLAVVLSDVLLGSIMVHFPQVEDVLDMASRIIMSVCVVQLFFHLFLYDMAITQRMRQVRTAAFRLLLLLAAAATLLSAAAPFLPYTWLYSQSRHAYGIFSRILQLAVLLVCLYAGIFLIIRYKAALNTREYFVLLSSHCLLVFDVCAELLLDERNLSSYITLAFVLILYYVLLHKSDQYVSASSRCFDRDGFQKVLRERAQYQEEFICLGICIDNIESITNFCDETEIRQLHGRLGAILREYGGRHQVYQTHSFEYMLLLRAGENVEKKYELLKRKIPSYIRLNNKNISLLCGFYTMRFSEASYDMTDFNRIVTRMRKIAASQTDVGVLLSYSGETRENIQKDLAQMQEVNRCIANHDFDFDICTIQSLTEEKRMSAEFVLCRHTEDGENISQERIWELAAESGYLNVTGFFMMDMLCQYIEEQNWLDEPWERFHVNMTSAQLADRVLAQKYVGILKRHRIPGNRICVEFTFEQSVEEEKLLESFSVLKEYGISLLLDQFGVTVCNLKNTLNMPFDAVKVNHHMVHTFCEGNNHQLIYLVNMLKEKKWDIVLDGIDDMAQIPMLRELEVTAIQGRAITTQSAAAAACQMEQAEGRCVGS